MFALVLSVVSWVLFDARCWCSSLLMFGCSRCCSFGVCCWLCLLYFVVVCCLFFCLFVAVVFICCGGVVVVRRWLLMVVCCGCGVLSLCLFLFDRCCLWLYVWSLCVVWCVFVVRRLLVVVVVGWCCCFVLLLVRGLIFVGCWSSAIGCWPLFLYVLVFGVCCLLLLFHA